MQDHERLQQLLRAGHAAISITTLEEDHALGLVRRAALERGDTLWLWTAIDGLRDGLVAGSDPVKDTEHPAAALYYISHRLTAPAVCVMLDLADHLDDKKVRRLLRETIALLHAGDSTLVLIDHSSPLPDVIAAAATPFEIPLPGDEELQSIVRDTLRRIHRKNTIEVEITRRQLDTVIRNLRGLSRSQAEQIITDVVADDRRFGAEDINRILARKRQALAASGLLEYVEAPVDLSAIGGIRRLKAWLKQRERAITAEAASFGLSAPRGVLMLGVQGAGKSLCAKAIATAWQRPLLRLEPGALYDRYVGESERRLRDALRQAEMMAPIILWIDEIEKAFASAASRSTDGGLSQRMFGTLLTWMQEHQAPVFIVATANDIEALPPELLRKGRFDEIFFVDLPGGETRRQILSIHIAKRHRNPQAFDLEALAGAAEGFSGAEIEQAVVAALLDAFDNNSELTTERILTALRNSPPLSVTMAESIEALRAWAQGRCVPAD